MSGYSRNASVAAYQSVAAHGGVAASDPHRLILMLMDGALERIGAARGAIQNDAMEQKTRLIHRTVAIIDELRASLNFEAGGTVAQQMGDLYEYISRQLLRANLENKVELLDESSHLLRELRSAWILVPGLAGPVR
jgi:flagellar secretion chaperone FliS